MSVTIRDVARVAGVSISTVSRALANPEQVAEATRHQVQETARTMGYRPNRNARALITGRTGSIGLVVPDLENPFFGSICKGVQARARAAGYAVFIADTDEDATLEDEVVRSLGKQVDGVILCSPRGSDENVAKAAEDGALIVINRTLADISSITFDNSGGARSVMRHLVALGHRRIAYAAGPLNSWSNRERALALREYTAETAGIELVEIGNFPPVFAGGVQAADLAIASGATAIVAFNDLVAAGLVDRLRHRGLSVPGDISVAGFDNVPMSALVWPNLTTVDSPRIQMGRASVDALLDTVLGRSTAPPSNLEIPVELVVRQSTGVVRRAWRIHDE
ncbi:LacI family DNA-binding transcriptional regulator [Cryobacterium psychrophilum]|uniref:LacI family transcriptional regulator n=1 Tax=Cryobacterium psychrophilum TaxID=41988 RepID=A0A4Y8KRF2_9MICO|nr:LacI family DNA-binding transcriptional regulator [Cryobacterium psychrophilum]TDW30581.1 LacI family transcriptional regulator [Cryobacterium psychrophilum]TFD80202.1 LacI family transcriptional regulator [Cryobacterium psychrophilum]